jgi:hypothetical protein
LLKRESFTLLLFLVLQSSTLRTVLLRLFVTSWMDNALRAARALYHAQIQANLSSSKYVASLDPSREVVLILAIVFRFAFEMGYHRDPEHFSHLSILEGEMRRRVW